MKSRMLTTLAMSLVVLAVMLMLPASASCQTNYEDVIYLKDGSVIRGIIVEQVPGVSIKIKTGDGNIFVYKTEEIERFAKEETLNRSGAMSGQKIGSKKEPAVAFLLSLVLTGGGQFYNGEGGKGAMMLGLVILGYVLFIAFLETYTYDWYSGYGDSSGSDGVAYAGLGLALVASIWSMVDAPISAGRINRENGWAKSDEAPKMNLMLADISQGRKVSPGLRFSLSF